MCLLRTEAAAGGKRDWVSAVKICEQGHRSSEQSAEGKIEISLDKFVMHIIWVII